MRIGLLRLTLLSVLALSTCADVPHPGNWWISSKERVWQKQETAPHPFWGHSTYYHGRENLPPAWLEKPVSPPTWQSRFKNPLYSRPMPGVDPSCVDHSRSGVMRGMFYRCGYQALPEIPQENWQWAQPIRRRYAPSPRPGIRVEEVRERPFIYREASY